MKAFLRYFFGAGETVEFQNFGLSHFLPILIMLAVIFAIAKYREPLKNYRNEQRIRLGLAFALIITEMSYYWRLIGMPELGPNPIDHLPITVCGWCVVFSSYMLLSKTQWLFDISYFWLLSGTVFALLTPTVITYTGPTRFRYYQFWLEHTLGYIAIFYMVFVHGMRPNTKSLIRSIFWMAVLALIAYYANTLLGPGANYLFMARPETTPSILDILPPNFALRISIMALVMVVLHGVAYLPWCLKDKKAIKQAQTPVQ